MNGAGGGDSGKQTGLIHQLASVQQNFRWGSQGYVKIPIVLEKFVVMLLSDLVVALVEWSSCGGNTPRFLL